MRARTLLAVVVVASLGRAAEPSAQWVVATPPALRDAVEPLAELRRAQGFRVVVVAPEDALQGRITRLCREFAGTSYVVLAGALDLVPPLKGSVGRMTGEPTDNGYGLPDAKLCPAVAVGRLPARTADEMRALVAKTLAQERDARPGAWKRRLTVLAGAPEFSPLVDALIERQALAQLGRTDPSWSGRALYHNPTSRFCLPDDQCRARARAAVEEGQALVLYIGHSNAEGFFANTHRYLDRADWADLAVKRGPGVFATFGCLGCQLSGKGGEGYGVVAVRNPRGPAAVLGSHGICYAAMVKLASEAFTDRFLGAKPPERLGGAWLALKRGLADGAIDPITYRLLDAADGDPKTPQDVQRREHQEMFVLLGDPALRLPTVAEDIALSLPEKAEAGQELRLSGELPERLTGVPVRLTVERPRDSEPDGLEPLPLGPPAERARAMQRRHERANDFVLSRAETSPRGRSFEATLPLPAKLPWKRLVVRVHAATAETEALRCAVVPVAVRAVVSPGGSGIQ